MNYYIADAHFGHENIIKYDYENGGRKFNSVEEHDNLLIENWNKKVTKQDNVYILGDFSWLYAKDTLQILKKLNGAKFLVKGNHDRWCKDGACKKELQGIYDYAMIHDEDKTIVMSHYPIMMWNGQHRGSIHLYGHVHNTDEERLYQEYLSNLAKYYNETRGEYFKPKAFNVGCMHWNYEPVSLKEILLANGEGVNR